MPWASSTLTARYLRASSRGIRILGCFARDLRCYFARKSCVLSDFIPWESYRSANRLVGIAKPEKS